MIVKKDKHKQYEYTAFQISCPEDLINIGNDGWICIFNYKAGYNGYYHLCYREKCNNKIQL